MLEEFRPYGVMHLMVVLIALAIGTALLRAVRRHERAGDEEAVQLWCRRLGIAILGFNGIVQLYRLTPSVWNIDVSLPLHLCDFAWMAAGVALLTRARLPRALVFYWGLGLSWQAFLTPTVNDGLAHLTFWSFWILHGGIVITALAEVIVFDFRPTWRDWAATVVVTFLLFLGVLGLNLVWDTPYFFNSPDDGHVAGTPIALLGAWPLRLVWLALIVIGLFAGMTWLGQRRTRR
jgi:hypothetical integral membrane protein (TIGR02206 family)